jgi:chromosome partitioning protein
MGKIIGICNQKGGTAKTTTAVNLAACLGSAGKKTLLIDMDPQGNATSGLGVDEKSEKSIYNVLTGDAVVSECIFTTEWENVYNISAGISLTGSEIELIALENRELKLREKIRDIKDEFDFIIIDAPPSLGILTVNVLAASDSILIPIQCEYYALEGVSKLVQTIELIKDRLNPTLEIEGVVLVMADFRTRLTLQVIEEVKNFFKEKAFNIIIPRNVRLAEAPSFGQPICIYDKGCVGAKAYFTLAKEVMKKNVQLTTDQAILNYRSN